MADDDDIDWDAFGILSADPSIDAATAYAASIRDDRPSGPEQQPACCRAGVVVAATIVAVAIFLFLMAM